VARTWCLYALRIDRDGSGDVTKPDADGQRVPADENPRLAAYMARVQTPLDLLALATLWIVLVPPGDFGDASTIALAVRLALSAVYAVDMTIRVVLAERHWRYLRSNPLGVVVVAFPPVRVVFSLRLIRSVFRRGNLERFLLAAAVLVLNGALIVDLVERHAKGSNIHTLGQSVWWAITTVSTVGYGDYYPVTGAGKVTASLIMAIGILTLAVITAQVASTFFDQSTRGEAPSGPNPSAGQESLVELTERLDRIEALLAASARRDE
jgi:voltage-gated potassium channel